MSAFEFIENEHIYLLDGVKLPSVTVIIEEAFDTYSCVPRELMERAKLWGNAVHKMSELHLTGDLDESSIDDPLRGPFEALLKWEAHYPELLGGILKIEKPRYHPKLKYAGTPDLEGVAVIDIKSRAVDMLKDSIQTTAYDHMTGDGKRDKYVLELKQDGTYEFTNVTPTKKRMEEAWSRFRYLLDLHNMKMEVSRWKAQ